MLVVLIVQNGAIIWTSAVPVAHPIVFFVFNLYYFCSCKASLAD